MDDRLARFRQVAAGRVHDRYLSREEEDQLMAEAAQLGLAPEQAREELISVCLRAGAVVERTALKDFRDLVQEAVHDRFLDRPKRAALQREGLQLFEHAPRPAELVSAAIREVLERQRAVDEEQLRQDLERQRQGLGAHASLAAVQQQRQRVWNQLKDAGVDFGVNDVPALLDECLPLPAPMQKMPEWLVTILVALAVAALMVVGFWVYQTVFVASKPVGQTPSSSLAVCAADCQAELRRILGNMVDASYEKHFTAPAGDSVGFWYQQWQLRCAPFHGLAREAQLAALRASPGWQQCEPAAVEGVLARVLGGVQLSGAIGREAACSELAHCLEAIPEHAGCCQKAREQGCWLAGCVP